MKRIEYCIVTCTHHDGFAQKVQAKLDQGWEIRGETRVFLIDGISLRFVMEFTRERR